MSQTTFTQDPTVAIEGMIADSTFFRDLVSKFAEVAIPFGHFCAQGTAADQVKLPVTTGDVTDDDAWGIAWADAAKEAASPAVGWSINDSVAILRRGRIWVISEDACSVGDGVFVRFATGTETVLGGIRTDADTATAVQLPGATFRTATSGANALAVIELNPQT